MPSFISIDADSDFSIHNIPFGVFSQQGGEKRCATRIGDTVVDLRALARKGAFDGLEGFSASWFEQVSAISLRLTVAHRFRAIDGLERFRFTTVERTTSRSITYPEFVHRGLQRLTRGKQGYTRRRASRCQLG